jgi:hypothetical protein
VAALVPGTVVVVVVGPELEDDVTGVPPVAVV